MIDTYYRHPLQRLFIDPAVRILVPMRIHPSFITLLAMLFGLAIIPSLYVESPTAAILCLALSGYCDVLDGTLARSLQLQSDHGAVFDIVSDRVVEFGIIFSLFLCDPDTRALPCLLMLGSVLICVTTFLVVGIFAQNQSEKSFHYNPGLMERTEAFLFFALMILFPQQFTVLAYLFTTLVTATAGYRVWEFYKQHPSGNTPNAPFN